MDNPAPAPQPAQTLFYHYTDGNGLLGMLRGNLWLSHIKYLNDSAEYSYALNLLIEVLQEYANIDSYQHLERASTIILEEKTLQSYYSFSLTERGDWLSQWRGYCPNGGYSFALNKQHIDEMCATYDLFFGKCIYLKHDQRQFIIDKIISIPLEALKQLYEAEKEATSQGRIIKGGVALQTYDVKNQIINRAHLLALIKDPAFEEEKEWRMIASERYMNKTRAYLTYRSSRNIFIPYLELPIPNLTKKDGFGNNLKIDEVIVSPSPHPELALESCLMMMDNYHCRSVRSSTIPYRNW